MNNYKSTFYFCYIRIILTIYYCFSFQSEIQRVLGMKVSPQRIVYANPCKQTSHLKYAAKNSVSLMTFDNETELHKVKAHFPSARLVKHLYIFLSSLTFK